MEYKVLSTKYKDAPSDRSLLQWGKSESAVNAETAFNTERNQR